MTCRTPPEEEHPMTETGPPQRAVASPEPVGPATLLRWRRTGLVAGALAVVGTLVFLGAAVAGRLGDSAVGPLALLAGFLCALVSLSFLRRAWSDPAVAGDPQVVRAQGWARVAVGGWCLGVLVRFAGGALPDGLEWLTHVGTGLGAVAVVAFLGMLVLAVRWDPARA
jgi:peptidoglycan biosynthesis protein MviN/MurJ (putative lipid II flippase)